jgi:hypothetical protein
VQRAGAAILLNFGQVRRRKVVGQELAKSVLRKLVIDHARRRVGSADV